MEVDYVNQNSKIRKWRGNLLYEGYSRSGTDEHIN